MLSALIRKDFRICRLPIVAGVVLLVAPFGMVAVIVTNMPLWTEATPASAWALLLGTGCYFSLMCSQATLAMVSGNLIAAERADRSAEFLASLPPSKRQILVSKLVILAACGLVIWGGNLGIQALASALDQGTIASHTLTKSQVPFSRLAAIGMAAVGAGWCASAMLASTGPPVALALFAPLIIQGGLALVHYLTGWPPDLRYADIYFGTCAVTGILLFLAGCVYFLRRVEP